MTDREAYLWLSQVFPYGSNKPMELLRRYRSPLTVYEQRKEIRDDFLLKQDIELLRRADISRAVKIAEDCERLKIRILTMADEGYPERLRQIYGPPCALYLLGDLGNLNDRVAVTVVGPRKATEYGMQTAARLSMELARCGCVIVSGCAAGVDSYAHIGAIKGGGRTIGVAACGLDVNYPATTREVKRQICHHGALVSELPPGTLPSREVFHHRNRLMSGLSLGVVVAEAHGKSGALITANHGIEQGRDIFVVPPHDIFSASYTGSVRLLRDGAKPVYGARDILEEYINEYADTLDVKQAETLFAEPAESGQEPGVTLPENPQKERPKRAEKPKQEEPPLDQKDPPPDDLSEDGKLVYEALEFMPQYVDILAEKTKLPVGRLLATLTELEIAGLAHCYSGKRYGLLRRGSFREVPSDKG